MKNKLLVNKKGANLIELMIALAIASLVGLAGVGILTSSIRFYNITSHKIEAQKNILQMSYALRLYLTQAVWMEFDTVADLNTYNANPNGRMIAINANAATTGATTTVAVFSRETANSNRVGAADRSQFAATGIYYQRPSAGALATDHRSGVIYLANITNVGATAVAPSLGAGVFAGRFVEFQLFNHRVGNGTLATVAGQRLTSVDVRLVARYHLDNNSANWRWCPEASMGGADCAELVGYRDITKTFTVYFRNNDLGQSALSGVENRIYGPIHFFNTYIPFQVF